MNKAIHALNGLFVILLLLTSCGESGKKTTSKVQNDTINVNLIKPPTVNVYIENTGSMDGYFKGITELEQTIFCFLTDIKITGFTDSLNLFYINNIIIPYGTNLSYFIENLEPETFRARGGNRGVTEISSIINSVLLKTDTNDVSILVTDGIFSPGRGANALEYLTNQKIRMREYMATHLTRLPETAVIIYKLSSNFDGKYFNRYDTPILINESRPFYIWIIGNLSHLNKLVTSIPDRTEKKVENEFTITMRNKKIDYAIKIGSGNFRLDKSNPKNTLTRLKKDKREGKVKFSVDADLSGLLLDPNYLLDTSNYKLNNKSYQFNIKNAVSNPHGYTHTFDFSADKVHKGTVIVSLKSQIPKWVEKYNDDVGLTAIEGKTFGIKYLINGVYEAFLSKNNNKIYTEIITIKIE